jgi:glycosyltransferase involved in cell wall biosynthesis
MTTVWLLTEQYYPEKTSTGYFLTGIAEGLGQSFDMKVITGVATAGLQPIAAPTREVHNQVEIRRSRKLFFSRSSLLLRLFSTLLSFSSILWRGLLYCRKDDLILVVTNPPFLPFAALLIKWLKGTRFVLLIHDVYPEALIAASLAQPTSPIVKLLHLANRQLYHQADRIVTLGRDMTQLVYKKLCRSHWEKVKIIPNWADLDAIYPTPQSDNRLLQELEVSDRFVFLYAGNMGRTHNLEDLATAIAQLQSDPAFHFIFIGSGAKKRWLADTVRDRALSNVHVLPFRPDSEKNISVNACNVAIISFAAGMAGVSVPSRMYNQMAAGKPIIAIAEATSELALVLQEEGIGWIVPPGDVEALLKTLRFAAANPALCQQMGEKAAAVARSKYTRQAAQFAFKHLFCDLFAPSVKPLNQPSQEHSL